MYIIGIDVTQMIQDDNGKDYARAYSLCAYSTVKYFDLHQGKNSKFCGMFFKEKDYIVPDARKIYKVWRKQLMNDDKSADVMNKFWWCIEKFGLQSMLFNILL